MRAFAGMTGQVHGMDTGRRRARHHHGGGVRSKCGLCRPTFDKSAELKDPVVTRRFLDTPKGIDIMSNSPFERDCESRTDTTRRLSTSFWCRNEIRPTKQERVGPPQLGGCNDQPLIRREGILAEETTPNELQEPTDPNPPYESSEADQAKARKWFERAEELAANKNWDFAIKCYIDGLAFWPDAVEQAHAPLRAAAAVRNLTGGKKPGFSDSMKYSMTSRDAKKAMLNAEWLLSQDPFNISYMEGILKNANKLRCEETVMWIGPIYANAIENEKKPNAKRCALLREVYEDIGDRFVSRGFATRAVDCYERSAEALRWQKIADPKDMSLDNELRDLSTKLTILKGKYESAETFAESMQDAESQKALHDEGRLTQADEGLAKLIKRAEVDLAANPNNPNKVRKLVELLCSKDDEASENRAIGILVENYKKFKEYNYKVQAEDIRIRQLSRAARVARDAGDAEEYRKRLASLLTFEIKVYRDRVKQYPTNHRLKFDLASRLFQAKQFDESIPLFQMARTDPKVRTQADLSLGRCFYEKNFQAQAIGTLTKAVENYEISDDRVAKDLRYWLGRSHEAAGNVKEAREEFGQILQLDYNFRDVRDRLQGLQENRPEGSAS